MIAQASVQPTMVRDNPPGLLLVNGVSANAVVYVHGEAVGETMSSINNAGAMPTKQTSIVSGRVAVVKNLKLGVKGQKSFAPTQVKKI